MVRRAGVPRGGDGPLGGGATSRIRVACNRGLRVFGVFVVLAAFVFVFTFGPFKTVDGIDDLPLPVWIMVSPPLVLLGAGAITGLTVVVVDLVRRRPRHGD